MNLTYVFNGDGDTARRGAALGVVAPPRRVLAKPSEISARERHFVGCWLASNVAVELRDIVLAVRLLYLR